MPTTRARMLRRLSGSHASGAHRCHAAPRRRVAIGVDHDSSSRSRRSREATIDWYVATGEPFDKAGAYAIQGAGGVFVAAVEGSVSNVIGLPLHTVVELAREVGVDLLAPAVTR